MKRWLCLYEWRKLTASRFLWLLCAVLLIANAAICWFSTQPDEDAALLDTVWEQYRADPEAMDAYAARLSEQQMAEMQRRMEEFMKKQEAGEFPGPMPEPPPEVCTFDPDGKLSDVTLIGRVKQRADGRSRQAGWTGDMKSVVRAAQNNKRELTGTMQVSEDSYAYRHQDNVETVYTGLLETVTIRDGFSRGWHVLFNYEPVGLFIAVTVLLGTLAVFTAERDGGAMLLRAYKKGRGHTAAAKLGAALAFSACVTLAFLLSTGAAVALRVGLTDPRQAIQAFPGFEYVPFAWTVPEYLLHFTLAKLLTAAVLSLAAALVMMVSDRPAAAFGIPALLVAGGYILHHSRAGDVVRQLNPYAYSLYVPLTSKYLCFPVGDALGEQLNAVRIGMGVLAVGLLVAGIIIFSRKYPTARKSRFRPAEALRAWREKLAEKLPRKARKTGGHTGLVWYEWHKQAFNPRFLILLALVLALQGVLIARQTQPNYGYNLAVYRDYMENVAGEQTPEKSAWIEAEHTFITETLEKEKTNESLFLSGQMDRDEYFAYLDDLSYATSHEAAFNRIYSHEQYLTDLEARTGIRGVFLFEDDWLTYLNAGADWLLLLLILFTVSGTFADEYNAAQGKDPVRSLIRSTKRGRRGAFRAKLVFAFSLSGLLTLLVTAAETAASFIRLDLNSRSAPLVSIELFGSTDGGITLMGFTVLRLCLRFAGMMIAAGLGLALGELLRNKVWALGASALLIAVPYVCARFGIGFMRWADVTRLLDGTGLWLLASAQGNDVLPVVLVVAAFTAVIAVLLVLVNRRYAGNRRKGKSV